MLANGGYGDWKYSAVQLEKKLQQLKQYVPMLMQRHDLDGIVVHGSSGVWLGAAIVMAGLTRDCGLFLVRKPGEMSHGDIVEGDGESECMRLLMLDDFVSSGDSVKRVQALINDNKVRPASVVAVYCHERCYDFKNYEQPLSNREGVFIY